MPNSQTTDPRRDSPNIEPTLPVSTNTPQPTEPQPTTTAAQSTPADASSTEADATSTPPEVTPALDAESWVDRCQRQFDARRTDRLPNPADETNQRVP